MTIDWAKLKDEDLAYELACALNFASEDALRWALTYCDYEIFCIAKRLIDEMDSSKTIRRTK